MQRKLIKIGEEYGVVARFNKSARRQAARATVVSLDAEYDAYVGSYATLRRRLNDGIAVRFNEDVVRQYDQFKAVSSFPKGYTPSNREVVKAGDEFVLESAKLVIDTWEVLGPEHEAAADEAKAGRQRVDRIADVVEPTIAVIDAALVRHGFTPEEFGDDVRTRDRESRGEDGYRIIDRTYTLTVEAIATLLGISAKP